MNISCSKNLNSGYTKIVKKLEQSPDWKKEIYNNNFATGAHSKKLTLGSKTMATNMGGIGGSTLGTIVINSDKIKSDSNCRDCIHRNICKYISYHKSLIEQVNQITVDSNFELRLWCKNYKSDVGVKGMGITSY